MAVILEPDLLFFTAGEDVFDKTPVVSGMVPDFHVAQFMDHYIINDVRRGHDQPPGECQVVVRRAGAPSAPGVVDSNPLGRHPHQPAEMTYPFFKMQPGLFLIPEVKKNADSSEGMTPQQEFLAGKCQGLAGISPFIHFEDVGFTQIGEPFSGDENPGLLIIFP
jgi:hypothetical protein